MTISEKIAARMRQAPSSRLLLFASVLAIAAIPNAATSAGPKRLTIPKLIAGSYRVNLKSLPSVAGHLKTKRSTSAAAYAHYFLDELTVSNTIESRGIPYRLGHVDIDNASCLGLRRYGVRASAYGLDKFWRFRCDADGADGHIYDVQISFTDGPKSGYYYFHFLSVSRQF